MIDQNRGSIYRKKCIGLDSGVIVSMIYHEQAFQEYGDILTDSSFNFTHEECVGGDEMKIEDSEVFRALTKKYNIDKENASKRIKEFLEKYKIKIIPKIKINKDAAINLLRDAKKKGIEAHYPDIWIVVDFKASGVNLAYSNNQHFRELCRLINIQAPYFPTDVKATEKMFFDIFGKSKKERYKKKFRKM